MLFKVYAGIFPFFFLGGGNICSFFGGERISKSLPSHWGPNHSQMLSETGLLKPERPNHSQGFLRGWPRPGALAKWAVLADRYKWSDIINPYKMAENKWVNVFFHPYKWKAGPLLTIL